MTRISWRRAQILTGFGARCVLLVPGWLPPAACGRASLLFPLVPVGNSSARGGGKPGSDLAGGGSGGSSSSPCRRGREVPGGCNPAQLLHRQVHGKSQPCASRGSSAGFAWGCRGCKALSECRGLQKLSWGLTTTTRGPVGQKGFHQALSKHQVKDGPEENVSEKAWFRLSFSSRRSLGGVDASSLLQPPYAGPGAATSSLQQAAAFHQCCLQKRP